MFLREVAKSLAPSWKFTKVLLQKRNIVTHANKELQLETQSLRKSNSFFKEDFDLLSESPRTFHVAVAPPKSGAQYRPSTQTVEIPDGMTNSGYSSREERIMHEFHHGAQHESLIKQFGPDTALSVMEAPVHKRVNELSAIATGKSGELKGEKLKLATLNLWHKYENVPGYGTSSGAKNLLEGSKFQGYTRKRLEAFDFKDL